MFKNFIELNSFWFLLDDKLEKTRISCLRICWLYSMPQRMTINPIAIFCITYIYIYIYISTSVIAQWMKAETE